MRMPRRLLTASAAIVGVLAVSFATTAADAKTQKNHRSGDYAYNAGRAYNGCPVRRLPGGDLVDCNGWRLRASGWDNSCLNLDYLPSQFACGGRGGRF